MDRDFIKPAAMLARSNPEAWKLFIEELKKYSHAATEKLMEAPKDVLQVAQGRAKQCAELVTLLGNAVETADRIEQRQNKKL